MPTMMLLALLSLLLLAVLLLVVALYRVDGHADVQNKRLQHLMQSSVSENQRTRSHKEAANEPNRGTSCQTCHICGGMRSRRPHGLFTASILDAKSFKSWVVTTEKLAQNMKQVFQSLTSCQKSQTNGDFKKHLSSLSSSSRVNTSLKERGHGNASIPSAANSVSVAPSNSKNCITSGSLVTSRGGDPPFAEKISPSPLVSFTHSAAPLDSSSALVQSIPQNRDNEPKCAPFRRLVLEILMSPGEGYAQTGSSTSASGLRLKFETDASLEPAASLTNAPDMVFEIKDAQMSKHNAKNLDVARLSVEAVPKRSDIANESRTSGDQYSTILSENVNRTCSLHRAGISSVGLPIVESGAVADLGVDAVMDNTEGAHVKRKVGFVASKCPCQSDQKFCGNRGVGFINSMTSASARASTNAASQLNAHAKNDDSLLSEGHSFVSLDGLGSLCVTFLKAGPDGEISEEDSREVSAQVESALAALNVNSGNMHRDEIKNRFNVHSSLGSTSKHKLQGEEVSRDESDSEHGVDDVVLLEAPKCRSLEGNASNSKRKEKKKKNRGKKQKGKAGAMLSEAQERQEIGKIVFEAAKHVSAVPEIEIGCVCRTRKGGSHSTSCPYPFTSSGSMLQRKIKEQYDELVRSNATKSLTLAQVGRFTTCLVEAKSALQQKSESIQRKFSITKCLLTKADKSSFDRLCGQIYGLEIEQKKLEEDTVVYNRLQEQLKLSPAYKKMLEYGHAHFELQPHTGQMIEKLEPEDTEMTFEELLAQEKKDVFWQKHSLSRASVQVS